MTVTCPRQCGSEGFENPAALEPLGPVERQHVLACVCKLLAIDTSDLAS